MENGGGVGSAIAQKVGIIACGIFIFSHHLRVSAYNLVIRRTNYVDCVSISEEPGELNFLQQ